MENENTEGKVSNMCVFVKLKTYSGIQEMNFCFLLQVFFFLGNSGRKFCSSWVVCGFIVLCWRKYERYEQLCLGAEKSKLIRAIKLLWPQSYPPPQCPPPPQITQNWSKISVVVYKDSCRESVLTIPERIFSKILPKYLMLWYIFNMYFFPTLHAYETNFWF